MWQSCVCVCVCVGGGVGGGGGVVVVGGGGGGTGGGAGGLCWYTYHVVPYFLGTIFIAGQCATFQQ